jgi:hypothetical protein
MEERDGWLIIDVVPKAVERAQAMRAERDQIYGNIYEELDTDMRWVGELGEIYFRRWLRHSGVTDFQWILEAPAGKPDFVVKGVTVDVKTVKRQVPMRRDYTAQVTARHVDEPVAQYFFACYEVPQQKLWMLGGIAKENFLAKARYYGPGERVHANYVIRPGHEIYNIEISHLRPCREWLLAI